MTDYYSTDPLQPVSFKRAAVYGRYSTIMQRPSSLEDQLRSCQEFADKAGWAILDDHIYTDSAVSGTSISGRDALAALKKAAEQRPIPFDYVLFDDTSRCARDVEDILNFVKLMRFHRIGVRFVSQQLDSSDPTFDMAVQLYAMFDAQLVSRIRAKVISAQRGRLLAGCHVGSVPYGYKSVAIPAANAENLVGQAKTVGSKLVKIEGQIPVVFRIYTLFVDGKSMLGIAKILNQEDNASPKYAKAGKHVTAWTSDAIKDILQNEKYKGWNVWNMSEQIEHPVTKKITKVFKPAHEHLRNYSEDLRMMSDELWEQAANRRKLMADAQARRVLGGYNRAKNQAYLFSGFLFCGHCGTKLIVGGVQGKGRYRCHNNRHRGGCANNVALPEKIVAKQIAEVLAEQLLVPSNFDALVTDVFRELQSAFEIQAKSVRQGELPGLQALHHKCSVAIESLIDLIEEGGSPGLSHRLAQREFERSQLEHKISLLKGKKKLQITRDRLDKVVRENIAVLVDVLRTNVTLARLVLSQHLLKMSVFYDSKANRKYAFVTGQIDIFQGENAVKNGVLLGDSGTLIPQQHNLSMDSVCGFGIDLDLDPPTDCPFLEPLLELLASDPALSQEAMKPGAWAELLVAHLGDKRPPNLKLGSGAIGRFFRVHRNLIEQHICMVKTANPAAPAGHLYQLSLRAAG